MGCRWWTVVAVALAASVGVACGTSEDPPATAGAPAGKPAPYAGPEAVVLVQGKPVARELGRDPVHRYRVTLAADQTLLATVEQQELDVMLELFDPAGKQIGTVDSPNGARGPEPVIISATVAGDYRIDVKRFVPPGAGSAAPSSGHYEARIDEIILTKLHAERMIKGSIDSPRLFALWRDLRDAKPRALDAFWAEVAGKTPLVEPLAGTTDDVLVTFVFRAPAGTAYAGVMGGPFGLESALLHLEGSDVWYLSAQIAADARFTYGFIAASGPPEFVYTPRNWLPRAMERYGLRIPDPNNPHQVLGASSTVLPGAPAQPWIEQKPGTPAGTVIPLELASTHLKESRKLGVYTPAGYDPKATYPLVIAFDGEVYGLDPAPLIPLPIILDNLIAAKKIPPVVAVLVASQSTRDRDLPGSEDFARFIALELVPKLRADYRAGLTPATTLATGSSFGGLASAFVALKHPTVVGNVLSNSGSFGIRRGEPMVEYSPTVEGGWMIREFVKAPVQPTRFYLDIGRFETGALMDAVGANRRLRDVLEAKGYRVTYAEYTGGHDYDCWRGTIADGLIALLNP